MIPSRRHCSALLACLIASWSGAASAQGRAAPAAPAAGTLPLRNVRLYEAGVAYFERSGKIGKAADLALPVPPSHLDDALKSLVVLGTDGKTSVSGVEFASSMSADMGRALAGLPGGTGPVTYPELLRSLKGADVELRTAREPVRGRLVDVLDPAETDLGECAAEAPPEAKAAAAGPVPCVREKQVTLLVLTRDAEVRRLRASEVLGVRPTDPAFAARLGSGLDAATRQGAESQRRLRVTAKSGGEVTLGYIAETPVWRSTYRMVLDDAADKGILQGWALVHNDTDEPWKQVKVELVNGRPDSFLFPLAAPRYARRELVTPSEELSTVPQLLGRTVDGMWQGNTWGDSIGDSFGAGGLGLSGIGEGGGGRGEGIGLGSIGTTGHGAGTGSSTALAVGDLASVVQAEGVESGALFRYALPSAVDLRAHGSALVPFLHQSIAARRIAFFARAGGPARSAARVKNDTRQTLPAGTIAFFADGGFAGESRLDRLKPGELRTIGFGADLDVELSVVGTHAEDEPQLLAFEGMSLITHFVRHHRVDHEIVNRSGAERTVFLALDFVRNAKVEGADELDFDTEAGKGLAVFEVLAKKQVVRRLDVDEGLSRAEPFDSLTPGKLRAIAAAPKLPAAQRAAVLEAAAALREAEVLRALIPLRRADLAEVQEDLVRLRGHVAALQKGSDDAGELVARMLHKEDRVKSLRARVKELEAEVADHGQRAFAALRKLAPR